MKRLGRPLRTGQPGRHKIEVVLTDAELKALRALAKFLGVSGPEALRLGLRSLVEQTKPPR